MPKTLDEGIRREGSKCDLHFLTARLLAEIEEGGVRNVER